MKKRCMAIFVFLSMIVMILTSCSANVNSVSTKEEDDDFNMAKEYAIEALSAVQDYILGDMSYAGAQGKVEKAYEDVEALGSTDSLVVMIDRNLLTLSTEMILVDPDLPLRNEIVSVLDAWDMLANSCEVDEHFGTSKKRQHIKELEELKDSYYDNVASNRFELGTAEILTHAYRENKGDSIRTSIYVFYSFSADKYVWSLASSMVAWAATEYQTFDIQLIYNGAEIGRLEFYDESKVEKIKNGSFVDNILENASAMELAPEYTESYGQIDSISMADTVKEVFESVVVKLR